jgi:U3 small nucleolar RNA-associated protein 22
MFPDIKLNSPLLADMEFRAPSAVEVVGSYKDYSMVKPLQIIDIAISLPDDILNERDIKSHRYFDKRAVYCAVVCDQVSKKLSDCVCRLGYWCGDRNKPIVVMSVPNSAWKVHLIPCTTTKVFNEHKLSADYKNLRESTTCDPRYNMSILEDMYFRHDIFTSPRFVHFARAAQLAKVWLFRRGLLRSDSANQGGFSGFQIRLLLSHLCQSLPREVSAYQLFKLFLSLLAKTEWSKQVLVYGSATTRPIANLHFPTVECTQLGSYNPLWRIPLSVMSEISFEAQQALNVLDDMSLTDPYEQLFCKTSRERDFTVAFTSDMLAADARSVAEEVGMAIATALGSRLFRKQVYLRYSAEGEISVSGDIDSNTVNSFVDKGPSADAPQAEEFRRFWGKKAELRRFKDGSILECVVWQTGAQMPAAEQAIRYIMEAKFASLRNVEISFCPLGACKSVSKSHVELWSAIEELRVKLTTIEKLPISIVSLRPSHAKFTATDLPLNPSSPQAPLDCVIEFESSQSWPSTRVAIWHAKCAFLLAIREGLLKQYCAVEIAGEEVSEEPFVDVKMTGGRFENFAFRCRIFANVEKDRLTLQLASTESPPSLAEVATVGQLWFAPMLRARIHALSATCPALSGAISQAKSWMDNHLLLDPYLRDWVEITMAHVVETKRANIPQSAHVLFLDWLFFLADHSYKSNPIYARLGGEADEELLAQKYEDSVESRRTWWISSDIDPDCLFMRRPTEWEAGRIHKLAKKAIERAEAREWDLIKSGTDNGKVFDVIITIKPEHVTALDDHVRGLAEQFRKYFGIHYSKRHGLIGIRFEPSSFKPQSKTVSDKSKMVSVIDDLAVPDIMALTNKLGALMMGVTKSIRVRE